MADFAVGDDVLDGSGHLGTVRFVGVIPKSRAPEDVWVGVEWADPTRGKYDGSIYGDRYFTCAMGAGSFISPAKLTKGLPFAEAVLRKYTDDRERPHIAVNAAYLLRREHGDSGAFLNLQNVDMSEWPITRAGAGVAAVCPNITHLNLARTPRLASWAEAFGIIAQLPSLTMLNLSNNPLGSCSSGAKTTGGAAIQTLILNETQVDWPSVAHVLAALPAVEELHLVANGLADVQLPPDCRLTALNLSSNRLADWEALRGACALPQLRVLLLCSNPLCTVDMQSWDDAALSPSLQHVSVDDTALRDWAAIDQFNRLPGLTEFSCFDLPLFEGLPEADRRKLLIARLPTVEKLNRSPVTREERERAERFLVRYYSQAADPPPAYPRLKAKYGDLQPLADVSLGPEASAVRLVFEEKPVKDFQLDVGLALWEFLLQVAQLLQRDARELEVFHKSPYDFCQLSHMERRLYSWRILDGDEIHVFLKQKRVAKGPRTPERLKQLAKPPARRMKPMA